MRGALKEATGVDKIEVADLDKDPLAANILGSLNTFELPMLASIKEENGKLEVCQLGEDLKIKKCAELKDLPP